MAKNKKLKHQDNVVNKENILDSSMKLQAKMLPPQFRQRSHWQQRLYVLLIVISYSLALGVLAYILMGEVADKYQINQANGATTYSLVALLVMPLVMFQISFFQYWNRVRAYVVSIVEFIAYILPAIVMIAGLIWINIGSGVRIDFFNKVGYTTLAMGILSVFTTFIRTLVIRRRYREAFMRFIFTFLGVLITSSTNFLLALSLKNEEFMFQFESSYIFNAVIALVTGMLLNMFGVAISVKYIIPTSKTIWKSIRFSGGLPTITIYTTLISISISFALNASISSPLLMLAGIDVTLLSLFVLFLLTKGKIKKMDKTNPLFNHNIMKLFIATTSLVGLLFVNALPSLIIVKNYGPLSFAMLAITAITIFIGVVIAHFMNLITYSKYFKTNLGGMFLASIIILSVITSIATLKHANIIVNIISRSLVILFLSLAIIVELILLFVDTWYIIVDATVLTTHKKKKANKKIEKDKKREKLAVTE